MYIGIYIYIITFTYVHTYTNRYKVRVGYIQSIDIVCTLCRCIYSIYIYAYTECALCTEYTCSIWAIILCIGGYTVYGMTFGIVCCIGEQYVLII